MNQVLHWSVKHVEERGDGIHFLVAPIGPGLYRNVFWRNKSEWICSCGRNDMECDHIIRARLYYSNMLARTSNLKEQLRNMAKNSETPLLHEGKRKIKLED